MFKRLALAALALSLAACGGLLHAPDSTLAGEIPPTPREFRAPWIATVSNIDWPSKPGLTTQEQQQEMIRMLDATVASNMNGIVFQIRTQCDALYNSPFEPWSEYLTGTMGKAPAPYYDPLEFTIAEAHKRGVEVHVWFNPYRARVSGAKSPVDPKHVTVQKPDMAIEFGKWRWLDPGHPDTIDYTMNVISDVVKRYDVDGIHIDDYFYPYKSYGDGAEFPDAKTYAAYKAKGGTLALDDWRRDNVNRFVKRFYADTKALKPWVKVGISPFGIWRPGYPPTVKGMDQYSEVYADAKLWFNEGWVDYYTPQCYWAIDSPGQPFKDLVAWWASENTKKRLLWPGLGVHNIAAAKAWPVEEISNQIKATRNQPGATGNVLFSAKYVPQNTKGLADELKKSVYTQPALVPAMPWLDAVAPGSPKFALKPNASGEPVLTITPPSDDDLRFYALYLKSNGQWRMQVVSAKLSELPIASLPEAATLEAIGISAVDRCGNESPRLAAALRKK